MRTAIRSLLAAVAAFVLLLAVDAISGEFYHTSSKVSLVAIGPDGDSSHSLIVFPGYAGDCRSISEAFEPHLVPGWQMVVLCYPERGIDDDQVYSLLRPYVESAQPGTVTILAGSMGGMVAVQFLDRLARSDPNLRSDVRLILDDSPADRSFVKMSSLLPLSKWYRGGVLSSTIWYFLNGSLDHSALEEGASLDVVEQGDDYYREIGIPALTSQAGYINDFRLDDHLQFRGLVGPVTFVRAGQAEGDPMIDVNGSIQAWRERLPELKVATLNSREGSWHVPWTLRPREILTVVFGDS